VGTWSELHRLATSVLGETAAGRTANLAYCGGRPRSPRKALMVAPTARLPLSRTMLVIPFLRKRLILSVPALALAFFLNVALIGGACAEKSDDEMTVYAAAQAARGRDLYAGHCASCHGMTLEGRNSLPLSGATFQARWADGKHSLGDLFYIVRTLMPYGRPATLSRQEYLDIVAYLLMMNSYPAGAQALPADSAVLDGIIIRPRRP